MRVVITGGTGFAGPAVVEETLREGHEVVVLEHRKRLPVDDQARLTRVKGDVSDAESLRRAFAGADAVVHLVAIIREDSKRGVTFERLHVDATRNVLEAAKAVGVKRIVHMSANGVEHRSTPYFETKWRAEEMVKASGLAWTIFRPSYIAGTGGKRARGFDDQFAKIVDVAPVLPSFGGGRFEIQPVSRRDVGRAFARAIARAPTHGKTYVLVGPDRMTWNDYLRRLSRVRAKKRMLAPVPWWSVLTAATVGGPFFPATPDQLRMMRLGNVGDASEAVKDLDLELEPWEDAVCDLKRGRV